tara:strand:+ start:43 stop:396 length:354 start_codon:yes stop_codon:yes gene_type:complete
MKFKYFIDAFVGAVFFYLVSFLNDKYQSNPAFYKILAFTWSVPLTYFYLLFIISDNKMNLYYFNNHALLGTLLTIFLIVYTISIQNHYAMETIIGTNFVFALGFFIIYFIFKIYDKL